MKHIDWGYVYWMVFLCMAGVALVSLVAVMSKMLMFMAISPNW